MKDFRCVHCGRSKDAHHEGICPGSSPTMYATMQLPEGKTCSDCRYIRFCSQFIGDVAGNDSCDWFPIRFVLRPSSAKPGRQDHQNYDNSN